MAATAGEIRAGKAIVEIGATNAQFRQVLDATGRRMQAFGATVAAIGAGISSVGGALLAPFAAAVPAFVGLGSEAADAAARTGLSVEALTRLKHAAEQSGAGLKDVEAGFRGMSRQLDAAGRGSKTAQQTFARLGLDAAELSDLSPDQAFLTLADALAAVDDPMERAALAMQVFGKSGANLLPLLAGGAAGIRELMAESDRLGLTMTGADAAAAEQLGDQWDILKKQGLALAVQLGAAVAPALIAAAEAVTPLIAGAIEFARENRGLLAGIAATGAALFAAGSVIASLGVTVATAGFALSGLAAALPVIGTVLAAIVSPAGLVIAAFVALGAALAVLTVLWVRNTESGKAAWAGLMTAVNYAVERITLALGSIYDALAAGDWGTAASLAGTAIYVEFLRAQEMLRQSWVEWRNWFLDLLGSLAAATASAIAGAFIVLDSQLDSWLGKDMADRLRGAMGMASGGLDATELGAMARQIVELERTARTATDKAAAEEAARRLAEAEKAYAALREHAAKAREAAEGARAAEAEAAAAPSRHIADLTAEREALGLATSSSAAALRMGAIASPLKRSEDLLASIDGRLADLVYATEGGGLAE